MSNKTGFIPTADKVLIEPVQVEEKTQGGIVLSTDVQKKEQLAQTTGWVLAIGSTCDLCPEMNDIKVGDLILVARYSGAEFRIDGQEYRIHRARDVVGKCERLPDSVIRGAQSSATVFGLNTAA